MKRPPSSPAFTLIETLVAGVAAMAVGIAVFAFLNASSFLAAKNLSLNLTSVQSRNTMDRVESLLQQGDTFPLLINASGATVATGPTAGVKFDRYLGSPYVIETLTGLTSTMTVLTLVRSTHPLASPPIPQQGDILKIDAAPKTLRPKVHSVVALPIDNINKRQTMTVTLTAALGVDIPKVNNAPITTKVIRPAGILALTSGGKTQLRYYDNLESATNLNDAAKFSVVSEQLGLQSGDNTPFNTVTISDRTFISFSLKMRAGNFDRRLLGKQMDEFNTFSRVDASVRPRAAQ